MLVIFEFKSQDPREKTCDRTSWYVFTMWNIFLVQEMNAAISRNHGIKCQSIMRFILNTPWPPLFADLVKSRKIEIFKSDFRWFGGFSACLPLSNSLEMFHDDVGMKSATTEEFAPGRGKEKNQGMLLIYGFYIIRNQAAVTGMKWFDALCWQAETSGQQKQPRGKRQRARAGVCFSVLFSAGPVLIKQLWDGLDPP